MKKVILIVTLLVSGLYACRVSEVKLYNGKLSPYTIEADGTWIYKLEEDTIWLR